MHLVVNRSDMTAHDETVVEERGRYRVIDTSPYKNGYRCSDGGIGMSCFVVHLVLEDGTNIGLGARPEEEHAALRDRCVVVRGRLESKDQFGDDVLRSGETTNLSLSDHAVGIGNIGNRQFLDENQVLVRRRSAQLAIYNFTTKKGRDEIVIEGSVVSIGGDQYCITSIEADPESRGWVSFQKLSP